jgi:hypothetical protein
MVGSADHHRQAPVTVRVAAASTRLAGRLEMSNIRAGLGIVGGIPA